jgi:ATP-binding cassette, subfamily B, bacterial
MKTPKTNLAFAWTYLKTERKPFVLALIFVIINAGIQTLTPRAVEYLTNNAIKTVNYTLLWQVTAIMLVVFVIEALLFRTQVKTVGYAAQRIMMKIRNDLFGHLQKLKLDYFNASQSGDLISRINSDTTVLDDFLGQYIFAFTSSFFVFIAFGIYMLTLNWQLALVAFASVALVGILSFLIGPAVEKINKIGLESNSEVKQFLTNNLNNYQVIQAYNIHESLVSDFTPINKINQRTNFLSRIFVYIYNPIYNLAGNFALVAIFTVVLSTGLGLNAGYIATLIAFLIATISFFLPLRELGTVFGSFNSAMAALTRIREILDQPKAEIFCQNDKMIHIDPNSKTAIEFENVDFTYANNSQQVLNSISFSVPTNSKFAIIGPTGEGKSTIAKLMAGLLSQDSGNIKIFGQELKYLEQGEFYNNIGFILQDPYLFTGTVASNIVYGNAKYIDIADPELLVNTLTADIKSHNLETILPNLDEFLKIEVNNNSQNISQGQKQIINFVRVLLREPKILILDEATANLDTVTEKYLQLALSKLTNKVTQIVIAHRLNTIKDADFVMKVGGGRVSVEENNVNQLTK